MGPLPDSALPAQTPARAGRLSLDVAWPSARREFASSIRAYFSGPRAPKGNAEFSGSPHLTIYWIRGALPGRAFVASSLWHVAVVAIALLPIWGFLASAPHTLPPVRIELTYYGPPQDLPAISLPGPPSKPSPHKPAPDARKAEPQRGADAFHPRQTILSTPARVTHPRQTLIQPKAAPTPPKIVPPMPNIVEWAGAAAPPRPQLKISPTAAAPRLQQRTVAVVAAPEVAANQEKQIGPLNIAAAASVAQPRLPMAPMSAPVVAAKTHEEAAAPDVVGTFGDTSGNRIIALSATPAPPAPEVSVPDGNLSARISISPEGTQPGTPGGAPHGDPNGGSSNVANGGSGGGGNGSGVGAAGNGNGGGGHASGLPAGVSISGGSNPHPVAGGGGVSAPSGRTGGLILKPLTNARPEPGAYAARRTTPTTRTIESNTPPEKILWDKQVYTLNVDMPNLTSVSGSWILKFAQLEDDKVPPYMKLPALSGPVPLKKVDPKYPPELIQAHVEGEVILYAIIRKDGTVDSIQLVRSLDPALDANSMNALAGWKFRPATREGQPVELETVVHIPFRFRVPGAY